MAILFKCKFNTREKNARPYQLRSKSKLCILSVMFEDEAEEEQQQEEEEEEEALLRIFL